MMNALTIYPGMWRAFARFFSNDKATTAIEYALIASGIAMAIIATVYALGTDNVLPMFQSLTSLF